MAIMTAAVHPALRCRLVREVVFLVHRKRVHIGAKPDPAGIAAARAQDADDSRLSDAAVNLDTPGGEALRHDRGRALLLESDLGMSVEVAAYRTRHPGYACGYRIRVGEATAVYIPDNELGDAPDPAWYRGLVEFVGGADLLLHDAMLSDDEYVLRRGWGHSTFAQAVRLAEEAGVRRLGLFHHAPDRSDAELEAIAAGLRRGLAERGAALEVEVAAERAEVAISPGGA